VDPHYPVSVGIESNISMALDELAKSLNFKGSLKKENRNIKNLLREELEEGAQNDSFPVKPQRIVSLCK
jgi:acetolactate synthase-1/2/3 large subunit